MVCRKRYGKEMDRDFVAWPICVGRIKSCKMATQYVEDSVKFVLSTVFW